MPKYVRLIAEAWDPVSYELGRSFPGQSWGQWNGKYRDDVRAFVKSDPGKIGDLMTRIYGSSDFFSDDLDNAYHSVQSVNYITSHDGFCLYDLVAYNNKHNLANGQNNADGTDSNFSWNCGWEGDQDVPMVQCLVGIVIISTLGSLRVARPSGTPETAFQWTTYSMPTGDGELVDRL